MWEEARQKQRTNQVQLHWQEMQGATRDENSWWAILEADVTGDEVEVNWMAQRVVEIGRELVDCNEGIEAAIGCTYNGAVWSEEDERLKVAFAIRAAGEDAMAKIMEAERMESATRIGLAKHRAKVGVIIEMMKKEFGEKETGERDPSARREHG